MGYEMIRIDLQTDYLNELPTMEIVTPPPAGASLFTLEEVQEHVRSDSDDEDALLKRITRASTTYVEKYCGLSLLPRKIKLSMTRFPASGEVKMPVRPVQNIESISYISPASNERATVDPADYRLINSRLFAEVVPHYSKTWPATRHDKLGIEVVANVGFNNPLAIPEEYEDLRSAILLMVGDLYENRESQGISTRIYSSMFDNRAFRRLLANYRTWIG